MKSCGAVFCEPGLLQRKFASWLIQKNHQTAVNLKKGVDFGARESYQHSYFYSNAENEYQNSFYGFASLHYK